MITNFSGLLPILLPLAFGILSAFLASKVKNRSAMGWFLIGVLFGPFGLIVLALPRSGKQYEDDIANVSATITPAESLEGAKQMNREELALPNINNVTNVTEKCPFCAEIIDKTVKQCPFCGQEVFSLSSVQDQKCSN